MQIKLDEGFLEELKTNIRMLYEETLNAARRDAGIDRVYLTIPQAMKYVGVSRSTLNNNFISRGLSIYKIEAKTYIKKSELNEFISSHKI